jgi:small nuclear ribonucleoprotein E
MRQKFTRIIYNINLLSPIMATRAIQRVLVQPISLIFRFLQTKAPVQIWLYEQRDVRIEGRIIGFDEFMNLVLDGAVEVSVKKGTERRLGMILIKGDTICLIQPKQIAS